MSKLTFLGSDFKKLIAAVTRFPAVGSFAGSETISLRTDGKGVVATAFGIVMTRCKVPAEGTQALFGLSTREAGAFASICPDAAKVLLLVEEKEITLRCKSREIKMPLMDGQQHKIPALTDVPYIDINKAMATSFSYLADVAYNDESRPELACVMLTADGKAIACDQKTIALLTVAKSGLDKNVALPVTLAKALVTGDRIYIGDKETVLKSGIALYAMPAPVKAQKEFPLEQIKMKGAQQRKKIVDVTGEKLAEAITECITCLQAKTEVVVNLSITAKAIELLASSGSSTFRASIALASQPVEEVIVCAPLDALARIIPFLAKDVVISRGPVGELFLGIGKSWIMFPAWSAKKKKK